MKPPPLLLGATLLFWGWHTGFLIPGAIMGLILEAPRWVKVRWEFSDADFRRIWVFCTLLLLAATVYAFTLNEGPSGFRGLIQHPNFFTGRDAGNATTRTVWSIVRWVPMTFFLFIAAQAYSTRGGVPLETISLILRARWKKGGPRGPSAGAANIGYAYFALCLFASSVEVGSAREFFWGLCLLLGWGLWPLRSRRFGPATWVAVFALAVGLGYLGQRGIGQLQNYLATINPTWFMRGGRGRFDPTQSRTELGKIGQLKTSGKIVIRLEARSGAPPPLLREATYHILKGQTWTADLTDNDWSLVHDTNQTTYVFLPPKTNLCDASIACYLADGKDLLPLPSGTVRLENLMAYELSRSTLGAVLEHGPGLVVFDAFFGPGQSIDSAPSLRQDLQVPPQERPALDKVISNLQLDNPTAAEAVKTLRRFFLQEFSYSTWQEGRPWRGLRQTPLARFLERTHSGHCEYFATAGTLLLRRLGIPARYAVGFAVHENSGHNYVVRLRDAHAWCLVWDKASGTWQDVDFTPGSWVQAEALRTSRFQSVKDWWNWVGFQFSKFRWGQNHWRQYVLWALIPILALLLSQIIFQRRRRGRRPSSLNVRPIPWPGLDSEFYQLEQKLARRGFSRAPSEPLSEWLQRAVNDPALGDIRPELNDLLRLHYRYRFDPRGLSPAERQALKAKAQTCLQAIDAVPA